MCTALKRMNMRELKKKSYISHRYAGGRQFYGYLQQTELSRIRAPLLHSFRRSSHIFPLINLSDQQMKNSK